MREMSCPDSASFTFPKPFREGMMLKQSNRFIMDAPLDGETISCHWAAMTRIGNLDLA